MSTLSTPTIVKNDMKFIRKNRTKHPNKKIRDRLNVLWLTQEFGDAKYIALLADVSARQVFNIIKIYKEQGMGGILAIQHNKQESKLMGFSDLIKEEFTDKPPSSIKEARERICKLTGIKRSRTQISKFLKNLGMKHMKPSLIPMGSKETDIDEKIKKQEEFFKNKLEPAIEDDRKGNTKLLFMDACHMQVACMLGYIWCFARKYLPALPIRGRVNVIGATSFHGKDFVYDINQDGVNKDAIIRFLKKVRAKFGKQKITIVLDNASYHHAGSVEEIAEALNIKLLFLPVASPNLNIIERLWKFIKSKFLKNHVFVHLDELENALANSLKTLKNKHKKELGTLLTCKFQRFNATAQFHAA
jgi:transposase